MTKLPVRVRMTVAFATSMALVLAGSGWFLYARLGSHLETALNRELELRAQDLATLVRQNGTLGTDTGGRFVERGESYAEVIEQGAVVDATPPVKTRLLTTAELHAAARGPVFADRASVPGLDEPSRLLATPVARAGKDLVLVVGTTRQDRSETLSSFRTELLIAGPTALILASLAGYALAGISLRQVESMRRRAAAISADTPGERLPVPSTGDELERLGRTLNEMLERLEQALERERRFVTDAGHELRTPLALLRTELELALRHGGSAAELRRAVRSSANEVDRLSQLAEDLLLVARADAGQLPLRRDHIDATQLLVLVIARFQWRTDESDRILTMAAPPTLELYGDRLRIEQALGNLVDNALRHGRGSIHLSARSNNGMIELHVEDEGAGFPPEFLPHAFERFTRPDKGREGPGAGLGLAIARTIAEAHDGRAQAENHRGRGVDVWLELPATDTS